jgi:hypothetical protein
MTAGNSELDANQSTFQSIIQNISGSQYNAAQCQIAGNCYNYVSVNSSASLLSTYAALYNALQESINYNSLVGPNNPTPIIVGMFDQYNNTVVAIYQRALYALQEAYNIEYTVNEMNYYHSNNDYVLGIGLKSTLQIGSLGGVPYTYFNYNDVLSTLGAIPTSSQLVESYNNSQLALTNMYAARINQLYLNTLKYIVSDVLVGNESYPLGFSSQTFYVNNVPYTISESYNFYSYIGGNVNTPLNLTNLSSLPNGSMLYQYGGINNVQQCYNSLESYNVNSSTPQISNALNANNCAPVLYDNKAESFFNNALYTVNGALQPYYAASESVAPTLSGFVYENLWECNNLPSSLSYNIFNGNNYLICLNTTNLPFSTPGVNGWDSGISGDSIGGITYNSIVQLANPVVSLPTGSDYSTGFSGPDMRWFKSCFLFTSLHQ